MPMIEPSPPRRNNRPALRRNAIQLKEISVRRRRNRVGVKGKANARDSCEHSMMMYELLITGAS